MDIEGNEYDALLGAGQIIRRSSGIKCSICSYHTDYDEILIKDILEKYGLKYTTTRGYMYFPYTVKTKCVSTKLHRGIVRGEK